MKFRISPSSLLLLFSFLLPADSKKKSERIPASAHSSQCQEKFVWSSKFCYLINFMHYCFYHLCQLEFPVPSFSFLGILSFFFGFGLALGGFYGHRGLPPREWRKANSWNSQQYRRKVNFNFIRKYAFVVWISLALSLFSSQRDLIVTRDGVTSHLKTCMFTGQFTGQQGQHWSIMRDKGNFCIFPL